jgi:hypothetical protein
MHTYSFVIDSSKYSVSAIRQNPVNLGELYSWSWSGINPGWFGVATTTNTTNLVIGSNLIDTADI